MPRSKEREREREREKERKREMEGGASAVVEHGCTRQQLHDEMTVQPIIPRISQQINPYVRCEHSRASCERTSRNRCAILGRQ